MDDVQPKCQCNDPTCSKCLLGNCKDENCSVHTPERKERRKGAQHWYIAPQTEAQIEENRKKIEELRTKGLLEKHEKTFRFNEDGTITQED